MKNKLVHWSMQVSIFLLRSAGWVATGIVIGFIVSFFFRPTGRVDIFAFTETMLGVVITGLSIVGAFIIALQWSSLDKRMNEFDSKVKETTEFFDRQAERMRHVATDTDAYVQSKIDFYDQSYKENMEYLDGLLKENAKTAVEINSKVDKYKAFYEAKALEIDERQKEFGKIVTDYKVLIEKALALQRGDEHSNGEEPTTHNA